MLQVIKFAEKLSLDAGDNACTTFRGQHPLKIWEGKNLRNLVRFSTTVDFDCEYL